jgi:microcystin-dependent protein
MFTIQKIVKTAICKFYKGKNMEEFFGAIKLVAFNYDPIDFLPCDGRLLNVNQNQALFALLGCTFGGDGRTTFALPKLESPAKGLHYIICVNGLWPSRP